MQILARKEGIQRIKRRGFGAFGSLIDDVLWCERFSCLMRKKFRSPIGEFPCKIKANRFSQYFQEVGKLSTDLPQFFWAVLLTSRLAGV